MPAELFIEDLTRERSAVLENGDGGNVGERLGDVDVSLVELDLVGVEEVECPDCRPPESQRKRLRGPKAGLHRFSRESRPAAAHTLKGPG